MTHEKRKEKQNTVTDSSLLRLPKNLHSSTANEVPGPTPDPQHPDSQDPTWSATPEMRTSQKYAAPLVALDAFRLARSFNRLPSAWTLYDNESREKTLEMTRVSGVPTQTGDREKSACNRRTREDNTNKCSIVVHIRMNHNREYCISIHLRIDNNHDYCVSIRLRIC